MLQNKILNQYFQRLAINAFHPLKCETFILAYQYNIYRKYQIGKYNYSNDFNNEDQNDLKHINQGYRNFNSQSRQRGRVEEQRDNNRSGISRNRFYNDDHVRPKIMGQPRGFKQPDPSIIPAQVKKEFLNILSDTQSPVEQQTEFKQKLNVRISKNNGQQSDERIIFNFDELKLSKQIRESLDKLNYTNPTPIQSVAIPQILTGDDIINLAQTGSGKTMTFVIPSLIHLENSGNQTQFPRVLVLAPTRELALQIKEQYDVFSNMCRSTVVYGGQAKQIQIDRLEKQNDVIIATPGRLIDFIESGYPVNTITQVILDEADRMLDMGFEPQLRQILENVRSDRQTLFFSATWPKEVQQLAQDFCCKNNPRLVQIGSTGLSLNKDIIQEIRVIEHRDKNNELIQIIEQYKDKKLLIFCQKQRDTRQLCQQINQIGLIEATCLYGDLVQRERDYRMSLFKNGSTKVLVATNLASRGLDVSDIDLVVNFDFPENIEDYVHRIGRTGRAGKSGMAISLIESSFNNSKIINELIKILKETNQEIQPSLKKLQW